MALSLKKGSHSDRSCKDFSRIAVPQAVLRVNCCSIHSSAFTVLCRYFSHFQSVNLQVRALICPRGLQSELALLRRHESEKCFGVQIAGGDVAVMSKAAWLRLKGLFIPGMDESSFGCLIFQQTWETGGFGGNEAAQFIDERVDCDFVDINCGCPLDEAMFVLRSVIHCFQVDATGGSWPYY